MSATAISYALLLASGGTNVHSDLTAQLDAPLPISPAITSPASLSGALPLSAEATAATAAPVTPSIKAADDAAFGWTAPYINAQPVLNDAPQATEIAQGPVPEEPQAEPIGADPSEVGQSGEAGENIIIVAAQQDIEGDPLADLNIETFEMAQTMDKALVEPVTNIYEQVLPEPLRDGLDNFTSNLSEPVHFLNFLLQGKLGKAIETLGRFAINTTLGVGGVFDVAKQEPFDLPYRTNGFANTLGFYGVEPGAYLFLPVIGSTTVRDLIGDGLDTLIMPNLIGKRFSKPEYTTPIFVIRALNRRMDYEEVNGDAVEESPDPYGTNRDIYLAGRQREIDILRGRIPDPLSGDAIDCEDTETGHPETDSVEDSAGNEAAENEAAGESDQPTCPA